MLGNKEKAFVASAAAGPALEGAQVKYGMRAQEGSIEKIRIDPETLEPIYETIGDDSPIGICGSGIIDAPAEMLKAGIITPAGRFNETKQEHSRIRKSEEGVPEYVIAWEEESGIGSDITVTQKDIREIQKAKGAIQAVSRVLMDKLEVEKIDRVFLAGAFGNYIDKKSGMTMGLYPECDLKKVEPLGNAAGEGAKLALMDRGRKRESEKIPKLVKFLQIAGTKEFRENYMKTMHFPHKNLGLYPKTKRILSEIG